MRSPRPRWLSAGARGCRRPASGSCARRCGVGEAAATGSALATVPELPGDEVLRPVTEAIRALLGVIGTGERLTA